MNYINKDRIKKIIGIIIFILLLFTFNNLFLNNNIFAGFKKIGNLFSRMYPFDYEILPMVIKSLVETLLLAFFSTFLGLITTILVLPFLSNLLFSVKIVPKIISGLFSIFRTIPSLIIAAILVSLFSVGNFSGFLSLYIIAFLMSSKILKEYSEEIHPKYIENYISTGFSKFKIYRIAIIENLRSNIYSVFFLVFESNVRGASVLGLVGAGGIGQLLWKELNHLRYDRVALIILFLILIILATDMLSLYFRTLDSNKVLSNKSYKIRKRLFSIFLVLIIIISVIYSLNYLNITGDRLLNGVKNLNNMFKGVLNPDFSYTSKTLLALWESFLIAFYATIFSAITTVLLAPLAAKNISGNFTAITTKLIVNIFRTFPPIIVAIIFFRGFGPGYISSFFALYIYTLGIMTKMYSEILENIDDNVLNALDSVGLNRITSYFKVIFKGYFPEFLSILLLRFEMNIKNSTILGMVGVGGIGQLLINNIEFRNWQRISIILFYLCLLIIIIENLSIYVREKIKR